MTKKHTPPSEAELKALRKAASRERGNICPIVGVHSAAEDTLLAAMKRHGFIQFDGQIPRISDAGRAKAEGK